MINMSSYIVHQAGGKCGSLEVTFRFIEPITGTMFSDQIIYCEVMHTQFCFKIGRTSIHRRTYCNSLHVHGEGMIFTT